MAQGRSEIQSLLQDLREILPDVLKHAPNFLRANQKLVENIQALDIKDDKQIYNNRQQFIELQQAMEAFLSPSAPSTHLNSVVTKLLGVLIFPENIREDLKLLDALLDQIKIMPKTPDRDKTAEEAKHLVRYKNHRLTPSWPWGHHAAGQIAT